MRWLAKNLILATVVVSAIFIVDLSTAEASNFKPMFTRENAKLILPDFDCRYLDFWSKFRDSVMPDPDEPQNNNPPKEDEPQPVEPKPVKPPKVVVPKPAPPPKPVD
ncbi:MAG: hypothetical protein IJ774_06940 [Selenomonadaceae bacterium]|nr:hypothetical protein [Selenomonadaceae bacterium]